MDINKLFGIKSKDSKNTTNSSKELKSATKKKEQGSKVPRTSQQTLPYVALYKNGIIETDGGIFAKTYEIEDINFRTAGTEEQEALFIRITEMLNTLSSVNVQFSCHNRAVSEDDFAEEHLLKMKGDGLDEYRTEANDILLSHVRKGNNISSTKYITLSVKASDIDEATNVLARLEPSLSDSFRAISNSSVKPLEAENMTKLLYQIYHPYDTNMPYVNFDDMLKQGIKTKDIIAPSSIQVTANQMVFDDETYTATMYMSNFPNTLSSEFIAEINDLPCRLLSSVHLTAIPQDKAAKMISARITNITANVQAEQKKAYKRGYSGDLISPDMQRAREDALELLDEIKSKNQRLFYATVSIQLFAQSKEELNEQIQLIKTTVNKHLCTFQKLTNQQEAGLCSCLPIGKCKIEVRRLLTTEMAGLLVPFSAQVLTQANGLYYGVNAVSNTMILLNRLLSKNANGVIFGTSGAGKSFAAKREMISVLLGTEADLFVVDPDGEYAPLAKMLGGQIIKIGAGLKNYINPLDMDIRYGDDDKAADPITLKSDYMCSLCETIVGGRYGLSPIQKSVIDRCVKIVYQPYMEHMRNHPELTCDREAAPTLIQFYETLLAQEEPEAQNIALALELYCTGSLDAFAHNTNVETTSRFVVYDIKDIGTGLHELGLQVCLNDIWNRMIANSAKGKYTWFYLDEFYMLTQHESSAKFLQKIYKRARKFGGVPTGITQDVEDLLQNTECRAILNNCDFVMMLNQSAVGRAELSSMYNISSFLQRNITEVQPGHGLLWTGNTLVPFEDKYPTDTKTYKAMTTKMSDLTREEQ